MSVCQLPWSGSLHLPSCMLLLVETSKRGTRKSMRYLSHRGPDCPIVLLPVHDSMAVVNAWIDWEPAGSEQKG